MDNPEEEPIVFANDEANLIHSAHVLHDLREQFKDLNGYRTLTFDSITPSLANICFAILAADYDVKSSHYIRYWFKDGRYSIHEFWNKNKVQFKSNTVSGIKDWLNSH